MSFLTRVFPFLGWFDGYNKATLRADFVAGLTVALVLVPQSMAYAQLAGLPPYYGLYAAFLPPIVANLFGSSRQLATGPVAVVSLMTAAALEPLATAGSQGYVAYAVLLALLVGFFQLALGLLRLGLIVNFLSHPVVNGFTNAAALIIATSQLSKIFGVYVDKAPHHYQTIGRVVMAAIEHTHFPTLGMAAIAFATMIGLRKWLPKMPNVLVAVVITTLVSWAFGFEKDETVALDEIESERVAAAVLGFNEATDLRSTLEGLRAKGNQSTETLAASDRGVCLRCHSARDLGLFTEQGDTAEPLDFDDGVLVLHQMAGLVDTHVTELKASAATYRAELRSFLFVRTPGPNGKYSYHLRDELPSSQPTEDGLWRIKVGHSSLNPEGLKITGGGAVVATIPEGLPSLQFPKLDLAIILKLFATAIIISLLGFMEAISIAKAMAARTKQKLDPNQELVGQGLANIIGCIGQSYPVSGSFSRSAVNLQAGARTGMSNVFSGLIVMVVLLFLSKGLYHLPQAVLAAIIMMAVFGLLNLDGFKHAWRTNRFDGAVTAITFLTTLYFAPHLEWGIFVGVALSLGAYLLRSMRPKVTELAPHADGSLRDAAQHKLRLCDRMSVISFEGPLNFASASYLEGEILNQVAEQPNLSHLIIAGAGVTEVDASGEEMLHHVVEALHGAEYAVCFAGLPDPVRDVLTRSGLADIIGEENFYPTRVRAISEIYPTAHTDGGEEHCPYRETLPPVVELSLHRDGSLRSAKRHGLHCCRHIAVIRFDGSLNFANTGYLEQEILEQVGDRSGLRHVLLVGHGISEIDHVGADKLGRLVERLRDNGFAVSISGLKDDVLDLMRDIGVAQKIGEENLYPLQHMALAGIYPRAHAGSSEDDCPLHRLAPHLTELSLHPDGSLRDAHLHRLSLCGHTAILRFDGPFVFTSRQGIQSEFIRWAKSRRSVRSILFVASTIGRMEAEEIENLVTFAAEVREAGYRVVFAAFTDRVFEQLARSGAADQIGLDDIYSMESLALAPIFAEGHASDDGAACPLDGMLPRLTHLALHADGSLRDADQWGLALCDRIAALRFDGPINFATATLFIELVRKALKRHPNATHILIAMHAVFRLDAIGAELLVDALKAVREQGLTVVISGVNDEVMRSLRVTGGLEVLGTNAIYPTQLAAVNAISEEAHKGSDEERCPLTELVER